jgi:hypothetical protein
MTAIKLSKISLYADGVRFNCHKNKPSTCWGRFSSCNDIVQEVLLYRAENKRC